MNKTFTMALAAAVLASADGAHASWLSELVHHTTGHHHHHHHHRPHHRHQYWGRGSVRYGHRHHHQTHYRHVVTAPVGSIYYGHRPVGPVAVYPPVTPLPAPVPNIAYPQNYLNLLPIGYQTISISNRTYYFYPTLPLGGQPISIGSVPYYVHGGVYYQPYNYLGQTVYVAVLPP